MRSLIYLSNFWRTLEIPLINCEINLILSCSENCSLATGTANQVWTFKITDTRLYVPVVTLSAQGNEKLFKQLKSGFKRTINWNRYQSKVSIERQSQCIDYLIDPGFQGVIRLFVLSIESNYDRYKRYFFLL